MISYRANNSIPSRIANDFQNATLAKSSAGMAALLGNLTDPDIYYMSAVPLSFPSLEKKKKNSNIYAVSNPWAN